MKNTVKRNKHTLSSETVRELIAANAGANHSHGPTGTSPPTWGSWCHAGSQCFSCNCFPPAV